jgi:hypothetical protein
MYNFLQTIMKYICIFLFILVSTAAINTPVWAEEEVDELGEGRLWVPAISFPPSNLPQSRRPDLYRWC